MRRSTPQRLLRLAVQVAIFLALMIGVLLRVGSGAAPVWQIVARPLLVFGFGMALLNGTHWAKWPLSALCLAFGWWYFHAATGSGVAPDFRIGTGAAAGFELAVVVVFLAIAPIPDAPGRAKSSR